MRKYIARGLLVAAMLTSGAAYAAEPAHAGKGGVATITCRPVVGESPEACGGTGTDLPNLPPAGYEIYTLPSKRELLDLSRAKRRAKVRETARYLDPCRYEDSRNCVWYAGKRGNGKGKSFIDVQGRNFYFDGTVR